VRLQSSKCQVAACKGWRQTHPRSFLYGMNCWTNVRYWHKADMATLLADVRFWGKSGHRDWRVSCPLMTQSGHHTRTVTAVTLSDERVAQRQLDLCPILEFSPDHDLGFNPEPMIKSVTPRSGVMTAPNHRNVHGFCGRGFKCV
jgi:hypothetical protein